jgi:hypothetical protein
MHGSRAWNMVTGSDGFLSGGTPIAGLFHGKSQSWTMTGGSPGYHPKESQRMDCVVGNGTGSLCFYSKHLTFL